MVAKTWRRTGDGAWATDANWSPGMAPGVADDVALAGPAGGASQTVTAPGGGTASSRSLLLTGGSVLAGRFATGALQVGQAGMAGALGVSAGSIVSAATLSLAFGPGTVTGGRLTVSGAATLGGVAGTGTVADALTLSGGAVVQVGSLGMLPADTADRITIDATSSLEVGTRGGAASGAVTVDPGRVLSGAGLVFAALVNDGLVVAQGGTLSFSGATAPLGAGRFEVGAGATLSLSGALSGAVAGAVAFTGAGATLALATGYGAGGLGVAAPAMVSGFAPGETIAISSFTMPVSAARFVPTGGGAGVLAVLSGDTAFGSIPVDTDLSGVSVQVTPSGGAGTANIVLAPLPSGALSRGSGTGAYTWRMAASGRWNAAASWSDASGAVAATAPGAGNAVTLVGPAGAGYQVVVGPGASASLGVVGHSSLSGSFATGAAMVGTAADGLNVAAGSTLAAASLGLLNGPMQVTGTGAALTVAGAITLGGTLANPFTAASDTLTVLAGGAVSADGLSLLGGRSFNAVLVDASSTLELGGANQAARGTLRVDAGHSLVGAGTVSAAIVNDGIMRAHGGTLNLSVSTLAGAGRLEIDDGATLTITGAASEPVLFNPGSGMLGLMVPNGGMATSLIGTVSGFGNGDTIGIGSAAAPVDSVRYQAGASGHGTLSLMSGRTVVATLDLVGDYAGATWRVAATTPGSAAITVALAPRPTDPLFDAAYYLSRYPDVALAGLDPLQHYLAWGWREGRDPSALFSTSYYLRSNPDVAAAGVNPLQQFEQAGWRQGRNPSPGFDTADYLAANPDVAAAGLDPLQHYVEHGRAEGRAAYAVPTGPTDALVDAAYYYAANPDVKAAGIDAAAHYAASGWREGRAPDAWFDTGYYLAQNPDVRAAGVDPLAHYEAFGWREGRAPSLLFDGARYLQANPDVAAAGLDPLLHYMQNGRAEGRASFLTGGLAAADPLVDAGFLDRQLGATLLPTGAAAAQQAAALYHGGLWAKGLNPDAYFDTAYYLSHNPDVAAAHIDPLLHYETFGWHEGRDPSAAFSTLRYLAAYGDVRAAGLDPLLHFVAYGKAEGRVAFAA